jgi:hypothetical protein
VVLDGGAQPEEVGQAITQQPENKVDTYPISYADFPASLRIFLDRLTAEIQNSGGFGIAGRVVFSDGTAIASGKDLMINFRRGIDEPIMVYPNGWFIARRPLSVRYQKNGNISLRAFDYDAIDYPVESRSNEITYIGLRMNRTPAVNLSTIQGRIFDNHGSPIGGAMVSLGFPFSSGPSGSPGKKLTIASDGRFAFSVLSPTTYELYASTKQTHYEGITCSPLPGQILDTNLTLYLPRRIIMEYLCQIDGTRDFTAGHLRRGTMTWVVGSGSEGMNFAEQRIVVGGGRGNSPDLHLDQIQNQLSFDCRYGGTKRNGFYDAGAVDFNAITNAGENGYSMNRRPCQAGHVYVVKTYDGNYAKLIVTSD